MYARTADRRFGALGRMGIVVAFHAALLVVLARGFGVMPSFVKPDPLVGTLIEDRPVPRDDTPPVGPPPIVDPTIYIPPPDPLAPEQETQPPPDTIGGKTQTGPEPAGTGSAIPQPVIESARVDARYPLTQPAYPIARIRNSDEGAVDLEVYVMPNGRVGDARVRKSSGFEDFDRAAMQEARRSWRMKPATRDGVPFAQWYSLRVVFKLTNPR